MRGFANTPEPGPVPGLLFLWAEGWGADIYIIVGKVTDQKSASFGYDAQTGAYGDLIKKGIIDRPKSCGSPYRTRVRLLALVTTEAMVAEMPKNDSGTPAMPGGGMGGMDH
jgi:chaperonin GroEL